MESSVFENIIFQRTLENKRKLLPEELSPQKSFAVKMLKTDTHCAY